MSQYGIFNKDNFQAWDGKGNDDSNNDTNSLLSCVLASLSFLISVSLMMWSYIQTMITDAGKVNKNYCPYIFEYDERFERGNGIIESETDSDDESNDDEKLDAVEEQRVIQAEDVASTSYVLGSSPRNTCNAQNINHKSNNTDRSNFGSRIRHHLMNPDVVRSTRFKQLPINIR